MATMKSSISAFALLSLFLVRPAFAQREYPPKIKGAEVIVYKQAGDVELNAYVFKPEGHQASESKPAIVFFFGGGWRSGSPQQFEQHCRYLAARGMVAVTADYRVSSRHGVKAVDCVRDAKSAIRWMRLDAKKLGIDPERIVASGGSAGGHLAASCGVIAKFDEANEDAEISSKPNAMVLFNPAVILAEVEGYKVTDRKKLEELPKRTGVDPKELSPYHNLEKDAEFPPCLIFHGKADSTVPYLTVELFTKKAKELGHDAMLVGYEGEGHGFFNYGRSKNKSFKATIKAMDEFLVEHGFLEPEVSAKAKQFLK